MTLTVPANRTLTVPQADDTGGRAARPQFETPQTGEAVAAFGQALRGLGDRMETERLDLEMGRLQIGMTKGLNDLRLRYQQMGDPEAMETMWPQDVQDLKNWFLNGQSESGRPRVDPKLRARWELGFDDLAERHAFAIGADVLALRRSQRAANYLTYRQTAASSAASSDPGTRDEIFAQHDQEIDRRVQLGDLSPEDGARAKQEFRRETESAALIQQVNSDPEGWLEADEAGEYSNLTPEERASGRVKASAAIAAREEKARKEADQKAKEAAAATADRLKDAIGIVSKGGTAAAEGLATDPAVSSQHPELAAQLRGAMALRDQKKNIHLMSPDQLAGLRDELAAAPAEKPWQTDALTFVESRLAVARKGYAADPVAFAAESGLPVPTLHLDSPEGIASGLRARRIFGQGLKDQGYTATAPTLTNEEKAQLKSMLGRDTAPADRAALAATLSGGLDAATIAEVMPDPVLRMTGGLLAAGGSPSLGAEILKGSEAIDRGTVVMPPARDRVDAFYSSFSGLFENMPNGQAIKEEVMKAADALYAARAATDASGKIDGEVWRQAAHEVTGGTGTYGDAAATGGLQDLRGAPTFMPMGIGAARVEAALRVFGQTIIARDSAQFGNEDPLFVPGYNAADDLLRKASTTGDLPVINGEYLTEDDWRELRFIAVGNDRYALVRDIGGIPVRALGAESGQPYELRLDAFVNGAEALKPLNERRNQARAAQPADWVQQ